MSAYFPLFFDLQDRNIRVFGGGTIAARRAEVLLESGANVSVVSPEMTEALERLAERHERLSLDYRRYRSGELTKENIVLAATNDARVNTEIYEECRRKQIPVNVASDKEKCDFYFPALIREGNLIIGLTSGGEDHQGVARAAERIRGLFRDLREQDGVI